MESITSADAFYAALMSPAGDMCTDVHTLLGRPPWMVHGNCRGANQDPFFPERGGAVDRSWRDACDGCVVRPQCLSYAVEGKEKGNWGGTTERERVQLRRRGAA